MRDQKILSNVLNFQAFSGCKALLLYNSFGQEIETKDLFVRAQQLQIPVYMPRTNTKEKIMNFHFVEDLKNLEKRSLGIYEPMACAVKIVDFEDTLCIVPALCVDRSGTRIGYGGGYYDRFLENYEGTTAVLVYDEFILENLPKEDFDIPIDYIITESTLFSINSLRE